MFPLDVQHEITTADVLHNEVNAGFSLETRVEAEKERVTLPRSSQEDPLLRSCAGHISFKQRRNLGERGILPFDFVIIDDEFLLQDLDSVELIRLLLLGEHDLPEIPFAQHAKEVEVI